LIFLDFQIIGLQERIQPNQLLQSHSHIVSLIRSFSIPINSHYLS
jgi:hypothetical protein